MCVFTRRSGNKLGEMCGRVVVILFYFFVCVFPGARGAARAHDLSPETKQLLSGAVACF